MSSSIKKIGKRIIKFRAWDLYNEKMIELGDLESIYLSKDLDFANYEVMQYTGLKDKNGKEIYEGDILKCLDVSYLGDYEGNLIVFDSTNSYIGMSVELSSYRFKVVGNIYENPNLI